MLMHMMLSDIKHSYIRINGLSISFKTQNFRHIRRTGLFVNMYALLLRINPRVEHKGNNKITVK